MGYFNKINSSHTLLQAVKLKETQADVSKKTVDKLQTKISADIKQIGNRDGVVRHIKEALDHLNSLGTKTGASKQMSQLLESVLNAAEKASGKPGGMSNSISSELQRQGLATKTEQTSSARTSSREEAGGGKVATESKSAPSQREERRGFSQVYQTNAGCKAINQMARHLFLGGSSTSLSKGAVISEYENCHGFEIFASGMKSTKADIQAWCGNLKDNVKTAADAFYTPSASNRTTWRGADLTEAGVTRMRQGQENCSTFRLGQFFSSSTKQDVAKEFCNSNSQTHPVLFEIVGNSGNGVRPGNGLAFAAKGAGGEGEILYSPKACFTVSEIALAKDGTVRVQLTEVAHDPKASPLPY
jgi:hypothetical protein